MVKDVRVAIAVIAFLAAGCVGATSSIADPLAAVSNDPAKPEEAVITVTILGSGTPVPSRTQFGAAVLVQAGGENFLFDCGRGCTSRLAQLEPQLTWETNKLFITHMHSDHTVGIDDLWLNGWVQGRTVPLAVWGPPGTTDMMAHLRAANERDIFFRLTDAMPSDDAGIRPAFVDLPAVGGVLYDEGGVTVTAFPVNHRTVEPAYGYRLDFAGKSVVISGDTTVSTQLQQFSDGADVVLLEVMSPELVEYLRHNFTQEQAETVISSHLTTDQAARIFADSRPSLGVYYHTRNDGEMAASLLAETRRIYDGPLVISHDLLQVLIRPLTIDTIDLNPETSG